MSNSSDAHTPGWQGMTIKEILEKVDLFNISTLADEDKKPSETQRPKVCFILNHQETK